MTATEDLRAEHEGIRVMLRVLEKVCETLESGKKVDQNHLDGIIEFLTVFADKCHHGKEEEMLFPELEKSGISKDRGPIGVMLSEHEEGRGFVRGMKEGVGKIKVGGRSPQLSSREVPGNTSIYCPGTLIRKTMSSSRWPTRCFQTRPRIVCARILRPWNARESG